MEQLAPTVAVAVAAVALVAVTMVELASRTRRVLAAGEAALAGVLLGPPGLAAEQGARALAYLPFVAQSPSQRPALCSATVGPEVVAGRGAMASQAAKVETVVRAQAVASQAEKAEKAGMVRQVAVAVAVPAAAASASIRRTRASMPAAQTTLLVAPLVLAGKAATPQLRLASMVTVSLVRPGVPKVSQPARPPTPAANSC